MCSGQEVQNSEVTQVALPAGHVTPSTGYANTTSKSLLAWIYHNSVNQGTVSRPIIYHNFGACLKEKAKRLAW